MTEKSGYIELSGRAVYATAFLPEVSACHGVVMVEPLGEEKRGGYRMFVRLARRLASLGVAVLRFDLSGTGDSTLSHGDVDVGIWKEDTLAAYQELQALSGCASLSLVGARGGALIAALAASQTGKLACPLEHLILVEPWFSGQDCLNDLERRQSIKNIMSGGGEKRTAEEQWVAGDLVDFGGYGFSAALAAGLRTISLSELLPSLKEIKVSGIRVSPSQKLPPAWSCLGDSVDVVRDKPFWGQLDYYESDFVNDAIIFQLGFSENKE